MENLENMFGARMQWRNHDCPLEDYKNKIRLFLFFCTAVEDQTMSDNLSLIFRRPTNSPASSYLWCAVVQMQQEKWSKHTRQRSLKSRYRNCLTPQSLRRLCHPCRTSLQRRFSGDLSIVAMNGHELPSRDRQYNYWNMSSFWEGTWANSAQIANEEHDVYLTKFCKLQRADFWKLCRVIRRS